MPRPANLAADTQGGVVKSKRPDSASWTAAKQQGDDAELAVAAWFKSLGFAVTKTIGQDDFDLLAMLKLEVKNDLQAAETGNVAVEVRFDGKPSGIRATNADWFVIVVGETAYMMPTKKLPALIDTGNFRMVRGGDGRRAELALISVEILQALPFVQSRNLSERTN